MSRIKDVFAATKTHGRALLVPYITAGDPHPGHTVELMHALVEGGADILELGVPFSDPMADGPVIQAACERALAAGTTLRDVLGMVQQFRQKDANTPIVLMGYLNPVECMGYSVFSAAAAEAGVDGVLLVDLTPEEAPPIRAVMTDAGMDCVFLVAPNTPDGRVKSIDAQAGGYLYYVSFKGVTGASQLDVGAVSSRVDEIRRLSSLPVAVGFGIRDADSAAQIAAVADAVVVGSAVISTIQSAGQALPEQCAAVTALVQGMREAMDAVSSPNRLSTTEAES